MGAIDFFARQQFGATLRPGEILETMGIGVAKAEKSYAIFGLTNQRFLVLEVPVDPWVLAPKPEVSSTASYELAQLAQVRAETGSNFLGSLTRFVLVGGPQGEKVYVLRPEHRQFGNKWNFTGFEPRDHADFNSFVPQWLAHHCAAGTFRSPGGTQAALAELRATKANRAAFMAHHAALAAQADAARRAAAPIIWPYVVAGVAGLFLLAGLLQIKDALRIYRSADASDEIVERSASSHTGIWADPKVAARAREIAEHDRERALTTVIGGAVLIVLGGGGAAGFGFLGMRLNQKKKEKLQQQAGASPSAAHPAPS